MTGGLLPETESGPKIDEMSNRIFSTFSGASGCRIISTCRAFIHRYWAMRQGRLSLDDAVGASLGDGLQEPVAVR